MKKMILSTLLLLAACSTSKTKLTEEGEKVQVITRKSRGCRVVAKIVGENDNGSRDLAKNHALNLAAGEGADSIIFDQVVANGKEVRVHSTAYRCQ